MDICLWLARPAGSPGNGLLKTPETPLQLDLGRANPMDEGTRINTNDSTMVSFLDLSNSQSICKDVQQPQKKPTGTDQSPV